jgi:hypothetical protein
VEALRPHTPDIEQRVMAGDVPSREAVVAAVRTRDKGEVSRLDCPARYLTRLLT